MSLGSGNSQENQLGNLNTMKSGEQNNTHSKVLIVDSKISSDFFSTSSDPNRFITVSNQEEAVEVLNNRDLRISGVFIQANLPGGGCLPIVKSIHTFRPATPIFVHYDTKKPPMSKKQLQKVAIQAEIQRPQDPKEYIKLISPLPFPSDDSNFDRTKTLTIEISPDDLEFIPVRIDSFYTDISSYFDVFMRLDSGKYLKILKAGQNFSEDRLNSYLKKGVHKLYIPRASIERCISHCELVNEILPDLEGVSYDLKVCHVLAKGQFFLSRLKKIQKISRREIDDVLQYTVEVHTLLKQKGVTRSEQIQAIIENVGAYEHSLGTTMISALISNEFKIETKASIESIGLASFLHDIGLYQFPIETHAEVIEKMNPAQIELYQSHPVRGAEILEKIGGIPEIVIQAVRQHHERRDGSGFPLGKAAKNINRVSEILGISDEFARVLTKHKSNIPSALEEMKTRVFNGFTTPVIEAFEAIFCNSSLETKTSSRSRKKAL